MGYIKEPVAIDFIVDSTPLTIEDRQKISEIIAYYKITGKKTIFPKVVNKKATKNTNVIV